MSGHLPAALITQSSERSYKHNVLRKLYYLGKDINQIFKNQLSYIYLKYHQTIQ